MAFQKALGYATQAAVQRKIQHMVPRMEEIIAKELAALHGVPRVPSVTSFQNPALTLLASYRLQVPYKLTYNEPSSAEPNNPVLSRLSSKEMSPKSPLNSTSFGVKSCSSIIWHTSPCVVSLVIPLTTSQGLWWSTKRMELQSRAILLMSPERLRERAAIFWKRGPAFTSSHSRQSSRTHRGASPLFGRWSRRNETQVDWQKSCVCFALYTHIVAQG